jgi:uroporphyrinogen-III decarboxylase
VGHLCGELVTMMTPRERYLAAYLYGKPDRIPFTPGGGRESTRKRWHRDGLPAEIENMGDITAYAYKLAGGTEPLEKGGEGFPVNERLIPQFEEKVLEVREHSQIVQDWKGNVCEIGKEFNLRYLRDAIDFVTRKWIKCPVETRADWEALKVRYNADDPTRLPADAEARGKRLANRTWPTEIHFSGPFWIMREWMGFEGLCMAFHDDPDMVADMVRFWTGYVSRLMERAFKYTQPDCFHISEDMAYKGFSMISPAMTRQYLLPCYKQWGEIVRAHNIPLYGVDSDGFTGELIPIWIEAGLNLHDPIEVAAGNDLVEFRKLYGHKMAYRGGVDKRAMAKGGAVLKTEMERIAPVARGGGYVPSCDHGIPSDVSWDNYVDYVGQLARLTGWL